MEDGNNFFIFFLQSQQCLLGVTDAAAELANEIPTPSATPALSATPTPSTTPTQSVTPRPSSPLNFPSTSTTPIPPPEFETFRTPTPTDRLSNEPSGTLSVRGKKRKAGDDNLLPKQLVNAAIERLGTPKTADDEISTFGKMIGHELRILKEEMPLLATN